MGQLNLSLTRGTIYFAKNTVVFPVRGSCSEIPNNCFFLKLAFLKDVLDVLADIGFACLIKLAELLLLRQPNGLVRDAHVDFGKPVLGLILDGEAGAR